MEWRGYCPICSRFVRYESSDDFWSCRDGLYSPDCPYNGCVTRERALACVLFSVYSREEVEQSLVVCEASPANRGISLYLKERCKNYIQTGYFPDEPFGSVINGLRNENLENLTLENNSIDIFLHLDVLEHLFDPFKALNEIYRVLKPKGICLFTVPTYPAFFEALR